MNPVITIKCPECGRAFTGNGNRIKANLANHMKGAHKLDWRTGKKFKLEPEPAPVEANRPYARKSKPESAVSYCPKCGCNIRAVQVAMGL